MRFTNYFFGIAIVILLIANMYFFQIGLIQSKDLKTSYKLTTELQDELHQNNLKRNKYLSFENLEKIAMNLSLTQNNNILQLHINKSQASGQTSKNITIENKRLN